MIRHYHKFASYRVRGLGIYFNFNYQDILRREKEREKEQEEKSQNSMLNTLRGFFAIIMVPVNCDDHNENIGRTLNSITFFTDLCKYYLYLDGRQNGKFCIKFDSIRFSFCTHKFRV